MIYRFKATLFSINNKTVTTVQTAPFQSKKLGKPGRYERRPNSITNLNKKNKTPTIQTHASIYYPPILSPQESTIVVGGMSFSSPNQLYQLK